MNDSTKGIQRLSNEMDNYKRNIAVLLRKMEEKELDYQVDGIDKICNRIRKQQVELKKKIEEVRTLNNLERSTRHRQRCLDEQELGKSAEEEEESQHQEHKKIKKRSRRTAGMDTSNRSPRSTVTNHKPKKKNGANRAEQSVENKKNGLLSVIQDLEILLLGGIPEGSGKLLQRLEKLEEAFYGEASSGPFLSRLRGLKDNVYGKQNREGSSS